MVNEWLTGRGGERVGPEVSDSVEATILTVCLETKSGTREVGVPLLVHRRCEEPMFSISNAIAYENLMVQAKTSKISPIRDF